MNYKKNLIYILIIFFSTISLSKSNESIAYLDLDNIVKNTKAGKSIINKLNYCVILEPPPDHERLQKDSRKDQERVQCC